MREAKAARGFTETVKRGFMHARDLARMLDVALDGVDHPVTLTITTADGGSGKLGDLLDSAVAASRKHAARIVHVEAPGEDLVDLDYPGLVLADSGVAGLVRFAFEPPLSVLAAE